MELYGQVLLYAIPAFLFLVIFEKMYGVYKGFDTIKMMDMYSSLSSGITNATKDVLQLSVTILGYSFLVDHLAVFQLENGFLIGIIAFITLDFQGYWVHRWAHEINFFWNKHLVHHSSEEFNLACALRQSISSFVNIFAFFLIPCAIVGVPAATIAIIAPIHLFAQFWYHTRHIHKMGFLEKIIVTPSHHRVHHAINPQYIDKNYGQIFILWDKWFGTFQEELKELEPVYGISRPVRTWNPIKINFQHMGLMIHDAFRTHSWKEKLTLWFQPTGYRPPDVLSLSPVFKIENVFDFEKYESHETKLLEYWIGFRVVMTLIMVSYFFGNIAHIGSPNIYWYGLFVFMSIYAYTELMDGNKYAPLYEFSCLLFAISFIWNNRNWFEIDRIINHGTYVVIGYQVVCFLAVVYFQMDKNKNK